MARRKVIRRDVREEERARLEAVVKVLARQVGNTLIPEDRALVGFDEFVCTTKHLFPDLSKSRIYEIARAVERRQGDPFDPLRFVVPVDVGGDHQGATMASSYEHCVMEQLPYEQEQRLKELEPLRRGEWAKKGGRPGKDAATVTNVIGVNVWTPLKR